MNNANPTKFPAKLALKKPAGKATAVKKKGPKKGTGRR